MRFMNNATLCTVRLYINKSLSIKGSHIFPMNDFCL